MNQTHRIILKIVLPEEGGIISLSPLESHRVKNVLRLNTRSKLIIVDGKGMVFQGRIMEIKRGSVNLRIKKDCDKQTDETTSLKITILAAILKSEKFNWMVQKVTELGVSKIVPCFTKRTIVSYNESNKVKKRDRWEKIALEAARQSDRITIPQILFPLTLQEAVATGHYPVPIIETKIVLYEEEKKNLLTKVFHNIKGKVNAVTIAVGPEGGFDVEDMKILLTNGFIPVSLGRRVLRAETASIVAVTLAQYILGDES